jgi:hypothetical protein
VRESSKTKAAWWGRANQRRVKRGSRRESGIPEEVAGHAELDAEGPAVVEVEEDVFGAAGVAGGFTAR